MSEDPMPRDPERARPVSLFVLGGTATMTGGARGLTSTLSGQELLGETAYRWPDIEVHTLAQKPSASLTFADLARVAEEVRRARHQARGVVIVQGTDTLEETAFLLDLTLPPGLPVVLTGAMRAPSQAGADGPANLAAALAVASDPQADGLGVLVAMNDEVHAALWVAKAHASRPDAFHSPSTGRLGGIVEGRVRIELRPLRRYPVLPFPDPFPRVDILSFGLGAFLDQPPEVQPGCQGLLVEALGAGHVPEWLVEPLARMAEQFPVVFVSVTGAGVTAQRTYGYAGSETDLIGRGLIPAGPLTARKARLLLGTLIAAGASRERIKEVFAGD